MEIFYWRLERRTLSDGNADYRIVGEAENGEPIVCIRTASEKHAASLRASLDLALVDVRREISEVID